MPTRHDEIPDSKKMIEIIDGFSLSTEFFRWLANDDLVNKVILEKVHERIYERVAEYYVHNIKVFAGGGEFIIKKISESLKDALTNQKDLFYTLLPELAKLKKKRVSAILSENNYTVVSQFHYKDQICGSCWEIYDIANLIEVYKIKKIYPREMFTAPAASSK